MDLASLVEGDQEPVRPDGADAPGDRVGCGHGRPQCEPDEHVLGGIGAELVGQHPHGHLAVDVIGVACPERRTRLEGRLGGQYSVHRPEREPLLHEGDVDRLRPALFHVVPDGRPRLGVEHQHDPAESGPYGVADQQVEYGLAVGPDRGQWLAAAVAAGHARGQDHQRWGNVSHVGHA